MERFQKIQALEITATKILLQKKTTSIFNCKNGDQDRIATGVTNAIRAIRYLNGILFAVGDDGLILQIPVRR